MTQNPSGIEWSSAELQVWKPQDRILISEWSEKYRVLGGYSEEKGPLRMRRTPYLPGILDTFLKPEIETVVFMKPAQIAGTEALVNIGGYYVHQEPCPVYLIMADSDTAGYMAEKRIQAMFEENPELTALKGSPWNNSEMQFTNGAYWAVGWASSVTKLGSKPFRILLLDEIDKPGYYLSTKEASALSLAAERKETFYRFKIMMCSTPTVESGNINRELMSCDSISDFHVPCPLCGVFQPMRWSPKYCDGFDEKHYRGKDGKMYPLGQVFWEGGRNATEKQIERAGYMCGSCKEVWDTITKNKVVEDGEWVERNLPDRLTRKAGFHINRLYSLLGKSGDIPKLVREFLKSLKSGDPLNLQGFVNSTLGEVWKETITKKDESAIFKARCDLEQQKCPPDTVAITAGIDVQKYGFWFAVRAWAKDYTSWLIHYGRLNTWDDVRNLLFQTKYPSPVGPLGIWRAAIDSGGGDVMENQASLTEQTYWFVRQFGAMGGCRIWATKGASRPLQGKIQGGKYIDRLPSGKPLPGGIQLILLDTDKLKDMVFYRLTQAMKKEDFAAYLHKDVGPDYARQIMAEEKRLNEKGVLEWVQVGTDNHLLDCEVLCQACAEPEWIGGGVNILLPAKPKPPKPEKESGGGPRRPGFSRPNWLDRR